MNEYKRLLEDALPGDIFVSKGKGLIPKIICLVLKTKYSHTFVKISDEYIIESNDFGVSKVKIDKFVKGIEYLEHLGFPGDRLQRKAFLGNVASLLGRPYDYMLLIGDLISRIFHRSRRQRGLFDHKDKFVCSELVAQALLDSGIKLPFPPSQMTPEDIYYLCKPRKKDKANA